MGTRRSGTNGRFKMKEERGGHKEEWRGRRRQVGSEEEPGEHKD